ncbi:hypothetical protein BSK52_07075 [Paenibacillus odorifer]|uniref:Deoxyguanosinetriphosphate triphosphohydrolase-like protein n=2 Tax=Paenibacillus odorifer TaxID=189426 RepID=A0A1R0Y5X9_9BACL|nr:hypothetical protein BSK52_07075 [Paenibacillus odorifer]
MESSKEKERVSSRDGFERDHGRIVHSTAFRRLQAKTQVIGIEEGDYHRTRLTHSMEVAQIARGIVIHLNDTSNLLKNMGAEIDNSLVETASLAHDIGHPPFGHKGERALNKKMIEAGAYGFEGNAQTFRILSRLEGSEEGGLKLTRATLFSLLKYPIIFSKAINDEFYNDKENHISPPKANVYDEDASTFRWMLDPYNISEKEYIQKNSSTDKHVKTLNKTLECSIIELADDIAYGSHDIQDGIKLGFITISDLKDTLRDYIDSDSEIKLLSTPLFEEMKEPEKYVLKNFFADLINYLINSVYLVEIDPNHSPRFRFKAKLPKSLRDLLDSLKERLVDEKVIFSQQVQTMEWKGGQMVERMFEAMLDDKKLLPRDTRDKWSKSSRAVNARLVCDYIAGMTDSYALNMCTRLFDTKPSHLFDI